MKEFASKSGGRHIYNSDFKNIQDLALSNAEIFSGCDGFIISGCTATINGNSIAVSSGYVYIDGKIRYVAAKTVSTTASSLYIVPKHRDGDTINYADASTYKQFDEYYAEASSTSAANSITYNSTTNRFPNLSDVFFNRYALVKGASSQSVSATTEFLNLLISHSISNMSANGSLACLYSVDNDGTAKFRIQTSNGTEKITYKLSQDGKLSAVKGSTVYWSIEGSNGKITNLTVGSAILDSINVINGSFSGTLTANTLNVGGNATLHGLSATNGNFSGTVKANSVEAESASINALSGDSANIGDVVIQKSNGRATVTADNVITNSAHAREGVFDNFNNIAINMTAGHFAGLNLNSTVVSGDSCTMNKSVNVYIVTHASTLSFPECEEGHIIYVSNLTTSACYVNSSDTNDIIVSGMNDVSARTTQITLAPLTKAMFIKCNIDGNGCWCTMLF